MDGRDADQCLLTVGDRRPQLGSDTTMNRSSSLHTVLAIIAVGAALAYLLACRPSWHPDGTKVLLSYGDAEEGPSGIAMLDRTTGKTRSVFVTPRPAACWAQWKRGGNQLIASWIRFGDEAEGLHVALLSLESAKPLRTFTLLGLDPQNIFVGFPFPEIDGALFVSGKSLIRLDLESGDTKRQAVGDKSEISVIAHENTLYYALTHSQEKTCELGTVNTTDMTLHPVSRLTNQRDEIAPLALAAMSSDGSIMVVPGKRNGKFRILMVSDCRVRKSIPVALDANSYELGNLQVAPDKKTIYVAVIPDESSEESSEESTPSDDGSDEKPVKYAIAEIAVESAALRLIPVANLRGSKEASVFDWQISLSPDGKTLAVGGCIMKESVEDASHTALYLVDLTDPNRKIKRFTVPAPARQ
jgi:hypothetical protein